MIRRHITPALVVFLVLLGCCLVLPVAASAGWSMAAASLVPCAAAIVLLNARTETLRRVGFFTICVGVGLLLGSAAMARMTNAVQGVFLPVPGGEISDVKGTLVQDSSLTQEGETLLRVALHSVSSIRRGVEAQARGLVIVFLKGDYRFSLGEKVSFRAHLSELTPAAAAERYTASVERRDVRRLGFAGGAWAARSHVREWLHRAVARAGYPASALMEALLIGSREDVPETLYEGFKRTGSLHILALSGLHVTVIYGVALGLLRFLKRRGIKLLLATIILLFYQFCAGFMPSLLRATVMIMVGGVGILLDRDAEPLNLLAISGIAILAADPFQAFSLSFQLSYLALGGILVLGPLVRRPLEGWLPRWILLPVAMSIGAQLATLPLVIARFGVYYPAGFAAGLLLVPLTTVLLWAGLGWLPLVATPWPFLHAAGAWILGALYEVIARCVELFSRVPGIAVSSSLVPWVTAGTALALACCAAVLPSPRQAASWRAG
jgi:competence protein ComEC